MACLAKSLLLHPTRVSTSHVRLSPLPKLSQPLAFFTFYDNSSSFPKLSELSLSGHRYPPPPVKASPENDGVVPANEDDPEDGVSLGTMKLPPNTDLQRFEILLFQWANSLFQGANLPLPVPLKVDKIAGGTRLGFITIGDGKIEVPVYIDCLVFPATKSSGPIFRAIRNGRLKAQPAPGEPRIMRSLLEALQKSIQIARL